LFQNYDFKDGVKECCERLGNMKELLFYYIQQNKQDKVMEVCKKHATNTEDTATS